MVRTTGDDLCELEGASSGVMVVMRLRRACPASAERMLSIRLMESARERSVFACCTDLDGSLLTELSEYSRLPHDTSAPVNP